MVQNNLEKCSSQTILDWLYILSFLVSKVLQPNYQKAIEKKKKKRAQVVTEWFGFQLLGASGYLRRRNLPTSWCPWRHTRTTLQLHYGKSSHCQWIMHPYATELKTCSVSLCPHHSLVACLALVPRISYCTVAIYILSPSYYLSSQIMARELILAVKSSLLTFIFCSRQNLVDVRNQMMSFTLSDLPFLLDLSPL